MFKLSIYLCTHPNTRICIPPPHTYATGVAGQYFDEHSLNTDREEAFPSKIHFALKDTFCFGGKAIF